MNYVHISTSLAIEMNDVRLPGDSFTTHIHRLQLAVGTCSAVVGEAGAGKSLLLKAMAGLLPPDAGQIRLLGDDATDNHPGLWHRVLYIPQHYRPAASISVYDMLRVTARQRVQMPHDAAAIVQAALAQTGLAARAHAELEALSLEERQRFVLALGHVYAPDVLLLDDPLHGLVGDARKQVRKLLFTQRHNQTLVYTTRYVTDAVKASDTIIILQAGEILACGSTQEILEDPDLTWLEVDVAGNTEIVRQQLSDVAWVASLQVEQQGTVSRWRVALKGVDNPENALLRAILADRNLRIVSFCRLRPSLTSVLAKLADPPAHAGSTAP